MSVSEEVKERVRLPSDNEASEVLRHIENLCRDRITGYHIFGLGLAGQINSVIHAYWMADPGWKR